MKIQNGMNLNDLAEHMGQDATVEDAEQMRRLLIEKHDREDTRDISEREFLKIMDEIKE